MTWGCVVWGGALAHVVVRGVLLQIALSELILTKHVVAWGVSAVTAR